MGNSDTTVWDEIIESANRPIPPPPPEFRDVIEFRKGEVHHAVDEAIPILAESNLVYQRGGSLVKVVYARGVRDGILREDEAPVIVNISRGHLVEILSRCIQWQKFDGRAKKTVDCSPPPEVVHALLERNEWEYIPALRGVSTMPIIRRNGSLRMAPGYDEESEFFHAATIDKFQPDQSWEAHESAVACANELLDYVCDFPFAEESHKSVWLASVLTGAAMPLLTGPTPFVLVDANTPGTGKSLLVDTISLITTGQVAARSPAVTDEEELRKRITSHLLAGDRICLIDNVRSGSRVGWPALDAALTSGVWTDRELGRSGMVRLPMRSQWFATGNNLAVGADIARRTLRIRLNAVVERPELRGGFKHQPLLSKIKDYRRELLCKALVILKVYLRNEELPNVGVQPLGSFEEWSKLVRNAIIWLGFPDPVDALVASEEGIDEEDLARRTILANWSGLRGFPPKEGGLTAAEILRELENHKDAHTEIIEAIETLRPSKVNGLPSSKTIGRLFRSMTDRVYFLDDGEFKLIRKLDKKKKVWLWDVVEISTSEIENSTERNNVSEEQNNGTKKLSTELSDKFNSQKFQKPENLPNPANQALFEHSDCVEGIPGKRNPAKIDKQNHELNDGSGVSGVCGFSETPPEFVNNHDTLQDQRGIRVSPIRGYTGTDSLQGGGKTTRQTSQTPPEEDDLDWATDIELDDEDPIF